MQSSSKGEQVMVLDDLKIVASLGEYSTGPILYKLGVQVSIEWDKEGITLDFTTPAEMDEFVNLLLHWRNTVWPHPKYEVQP
jgi:hypothetical protein